MTHKIVQLERKKGRKKRSVIYSKEVGSELAFFFPSLSLIRLLIEVCRMSKKKKNFLIIFSFQLDKEIILLIENEKKVILMICWWVFILWSVKLSTLRWWEKQAEEREKKKSSYIFSIRKMIFNDYVGVWFSFDSSLWNSIDWSSTIEVSSLI